MALLECNTLQITLSDVGVAEILLARPKERNALNIEMIEELTAALKSLENNPQVKIVCLQGSEKSFCSGADLNWMQEAVQYDVKENNIDAARLSNLFETLEKFPKPTLAVVEGAAYAAAVGLIACCDIAIGTRDVRFCLSEAKLGLVPAMIAPYVIRAIGLRHFRYWAFLASPFSSIQAYEMGLVQAVAETSEALLTLKKNVLNQLLSNGQDALVLIKRFTGDLSFPVLTPELSSSLAELTAASRVGEEAQSRMCTFLKHIS